MIFDSLLHPCSALVPVEAPTNTRPDRPQPCAYVRYFSYSEASRKNRMTDIIEYCNPNGIAIGERYQEIAKPHKIIRPALWQLLKAVRQGRVDVLVITELQQLSAQRWKLKLILQYLHRYSVQIETTEMYFPYAMLRRGLA